MRCDRAGLRLLSLGIVSALIWSAPAAHASKDVLVLAKAEDPPTCDPGVEVSNDGYVLIFPTYEHLVRYKGGSTDIEPELADSWTLDKDGVSWIVKLKSGHIFDDGSPVDAAAVKFSFDRLLKLKEGPADALPTLKEVDIVDPMTLRFVQTQPFGPFMSTLATSGAAIVNPKAMAHEKNGDMAKAWLAEHTAGSGPYRITSWERSQSVILDRNPHYAGPAPKLKRVVVKVIRELSARRLELEHGDIDIAEGIPFDQAAAMKADPKLVIESNPSFETTYVYMNNKRPPLNDVRVRQALSYAVDYKGIIADLLKGQAEQMRGAVPDGMWGHAADGFQYSYDLDKAKALLAAAGASNLKLTYTFSQADAYWEAVGLALQGSFAKIGVTLDLQNLADPAKRQKVASGNTDLAPGNWTPDFADPYEYMNLWFDPTRMGAPGNRAFYENPKVTALITQAVNSTDQAARTQIYLDAQKITTEDAPYLLLYQKNDVFARRAAVQGFVYNPMLLGVYNFAGMSKAN